MRRGEIWLVALEPTVGAEIGKTRPVVIVSVDIHPDRRGRGFPIIANWVSAS